MKIFLTYEQEIFTLPINPEELQITRGGNNESSEVVGLGEINVLKLPNLAEISLESFAPVDSGLVDFISKARKGRKPMGFIVGETDVNMLVGVENFEYTMKAGEESEIYYTLEMKEWKNYAPKTYVLEDETVVKKKTKRSNASKKKVKNYIVKNGDTLYAIAKKYSGSGSKWKELYALNKGVIGSNPNRIYPKQKLKIPEDW